MSNEMISVPRDLAVDLLDGLRITQERARKELRALLAKPAEQRQGNAVAAEVCAYTPGMGQVELKLPGNLPSWMELGETVTVLHGNAQPLGERFTYSSKQATNCAGCGLRKHTPLRVDDMGGYVCLTCIDNKLNELLAAEQNQGEPVAYLCKAEGAKWLQYGSEIGDPWKPGEVEVTPLYTRPAEQPAPVAFPGYPPVPEDRQLPAPVADSTTSDKYKTELYDEVWQLARDLGFGNVTDALMKLKKQPAPVAAVHPFAQKVIRKLQRFQECAEDFESGGVDIGRHWLDLLTQLGLLNRVQRSPALWEITQQGEDCLNPPQQ
ncbi:hypothetical protein ABCR88_21015 [Pseudomonas sp. W17]|uniref:Uncharacterized protein n=1 Tax=Pseudomonas sp. W17 TaxID=3144407 RepID=A0AAU7WR38_9PSED